MAKDNKHVGLYVGEHTGTKDGGLSTSFIFILPINIKKLWCSFNYNSEMNSCYGAFFESIIMLDDKSK